MFKIAPRVDGRRHQTHNNTATRWSESQLRHGLLANLQQFRIPVQEQYAIILKSNFGVIGHPMWKEFIALRKSHGKMRQPGRHLLSLCNKKTEWRQSASHFVNIINKLMKKNKLFDLHVHRIRIIFALQLSLRTQNKTSLLIKLNSNNYASNLQRVAIIHRNQRRKETIYPRVVLTRNANFVHLNTQSNAHRMCASRQN